MTYPPAIAQLVLSQPYPLIFMTVSGAHLYGFPSPDSDYDLRGVHALPPEKVLGLDVDSETLEHSGVTQGIEADLVTHDVRKFMLLMLKKNGYVLEQLYSPLVLHTTPEHEELKAIGGDCITRFHVHHYLGFANTQWELFSKERPRRVKPLLYVYRVLLTGIHLMRTSQIESNLLNLNALYPLPYVPELVARKLGGPEQSTLNEVDFDFHSREFERFSAQLKQESERSALPTDATARSALNDLLLRIRMR